MRIISIALVLVTILGFVWINRDKQTPKTQEVVLSAVVAVPQSKNIQPPEVTAKNIFIMDQKSKTVLYQKNAQQRVYPASTTKMMSALVVLDNFTLEQKITVSQEYKIGQYVGFKPGEEITIEELLYAMLVQSGNDAAEILAENYLYFGFSIL